MMFLPQLSLLESPTADDNLTIWSLLRVPTIFVTLMSTCVASMLWVLLDPTLEPHLRQVGYEKSGHVAIQQFVCRVC